MDKFLGALNTGAGNILSKLGGASGGIGGGTPFGMAANAANSLLSAIPTGGNTSTAGSIMSGISDAIPGITPYGAAAKVILTGLGKFTDAAWGSNVDEEKVNQYKSDIQGAGQSLSDVRNFTDLAASLQDANAINVQNADLGTQGFWNHDVDNARSELQSKKDTLALVGLNSLNNINMAGKRNIFNTVLADGGNIYIKPSKRGTFTAAAKSGGMGVQEFASKVLANTEDYSPAMVKKANFARVFGGRHYANGGMVNYKVGSTYEVDNDEYQRLIKLGYKVRIV